MNYSGHLNTRPCPVCGKAFIPAALHTYKIPSPRGPQLVCSWGCQRKDEKRREAEALQRTATRKTQARTSTRKDLEAQLRPCPFCGNRVRITDLQADRKGVGMTFECYGCGLIVQRRAHYPGDPLAALIRFWNGEDAKPKEDQT